MQRTTIVFPCYNEEKRFEKNEFLKFVQENPNIHLLFVDDGSTDNSLSLFQEIQSSCSDRVVVHSLNRNCGKAEAVRQGLIKAIESGAPIVGYADTDLATPLVELKRLVELLDEGDYKILLGSRVKLLGKHIKRKLIRHYLGRVFATFTSMILNLAVYDTQCGAKFFKCRNELNAALKFPFISKWVFDVELIKRLLHMKGMRESDFYEEPLCYWEDKGGSKLTILAMFRAAIDLFRISITKSGDRIKI